MSPAVAQFIRVSHVLILGWFSCYPIKAQHALYVLVPWDAGVNNDVPILDGNSRWNRHDQLPL